MVDITQHLARENTTETPYPAEICNTLEGKEPSDAS
jgi:hypothetical protein